MVRRFRDETGDPYGGMGLLPDGAPCDVHSSSGPDMDRLVLRVGTREGEITDPQGFRPRLEESPEAALRLPARIEYVEAETLLALGPPHKIPRIHEAE